MKVLIPILIGLLVVGCGPEEDEGNNSVGTVIGPKPNPVKPKPTRELTPEEKKIVGTYERRGPTGIIFGFALLDNGIMEYQKNGKKTTRNEWNQIVEYRKWSLVGNEVHAFMDDNTVWVFRINPDISIIYIAEIKYGKRDDIEKYSGDHTITYKKVK